MTVNESDARIALPRSQLFQKFGAKGLILTTLALVLVFIWVFFVRPEMRFRAVVQRYPIGTQAETILKDYKGKVTLETSGNIPVLGPTEEDTERTRRKYI